MMEDWTDIIGEELENIEAPLPADDWSVLQQKYAAAQRKKRAAAFAWAGGITSVAAAVALVLLLVRPDSSSVIPGSTGDLNDLVAESLPPIEEVVPADSSHVESPIDTAHYVAPSVQKKVSVPVDVVKKSVDDVLIAENHTEEITTENTEEVFDVIRDTTSLKDKLLADASIANKKDSSDDAYTEPTGTFGFDDFPEDEPRRKRRPMSIGMSGSVSGSPIIKMMDVANPEVPPDFEMPKDTTDVETPAPAAVMMRNSRKYNESYRHEIPISFGVSVRYNLTDKLSVNTGLNYTRYTSTRERYYYTGGADMDKQYAHYLGIPVRLDWLAVNKKHFNFYIGAGVQADKCIYATVGNERLREKEVLFGLNGALGFQVNIVPMVGLYFEPEISYALNEGSIETFRYNEPLMISARAGLRFNF
jgi:hypothetical protein